MSHLMTALAMRQTGLKPAAKIVLYWLADHHNGETGQCNPSINRLAKCCEMSRRSVETHLQALQGAGLITIHNQTREVGGKTSNSYTLCMVESDAQNLRMGSAKSAHGDAQNLRMMNLGNNNPVKEQEEPKGSLSSDDDVQSAFDAYNSKALEVGWPKAQVLNAKRKSALKARLQDAGGLGGWMAALDRASASPLCTGDNNRNWTADLDFLLQPKSFTRLMEGSYDARPNAKSERGNGNHNMAGGRGSGPDATTRAISIAATAIRTPQEDCF